MPAQERPLFSAPVPDAASAGEAPNVHQFDDKTAQNRDAGGRRRRDRPAHRRLWQFRHRIQRSSQPAETTASALGVRDRPAGSGRPAGGEVTLVTHDSFVIDDPMLADFEASSGLKVTVLAQGDAGAMVNQLLLTASNPLGDAVFGIDNTFASKALDAGVLAPYTSPAAGSGSATVRDRRRPAQRGRLRRRLRQCRSRLLHRQGSAGAGDLRGSGQAGIQGPAGRRVAGHLIAGPGLPARHHRAFRRRTAGRRTGPN